MKGIVCISLGQCGNAIGKKFWEVICTEHGIDQTGRYIGDNPIQLEKIDVFFDKTDNNIYIPRAIFVDLNPDNIDLIRASKYGSLFRPKNFVFTNNPSGNNFAKGYLTNGAELIDSVLDAVRKEAEGDDNLQGFMIFHSLGGGTGSGMGSLLIEKIKEEYPDKIITTFSVFSSPKVSDTVVEPYNATLAMHHLTKAADLVFCLDNEALYNICFRTLKLTTPTYGDLNHLIGSAMSRITAPLRFPSAVNFDLKDMLRNFIPKPSNFFDEMNRRKLEFPEMPESKIEEEMLMGARLKFLTISLMPMTSRSAINYRVYTSKELISGIFDSKNNLCSFDFKHGKHIKCSILLSGSMKLDEVTVELDSLINKNDQYFDIPVISTENLSLLEDILFSSLRLKTYMTLEQLVSMVTDLWNKDKQSFNYSTQDNIRDLSEFKEVIGDSPITIEKIKDLYKNYPSLFFNTDFINKDESEVIKDFTELIKRMGNDFPITLEKVIQALKNFYNREEKYFNYPLRIDICPILENNLKSSGILISNHTAIQEMFKRISEQFTAMFRRKAFLHWYAGEGMDEMEFTEAESNMNDLVSEYQSIQENSLKQNVDKETSNIDEQVSNVDEQG